MSRSILELKNLSIGFKNPVFKNINATIESGRLIALMGINGAGKSCLLRTIANLQNKLEGEIELNKKSIETILPADLAKVIGVVLTEKLQIEYLTAGELVAFGRTPYTDRNGSLKSEDRKVIERAMSQTGVERLKDHFFSDLSDGQKQKVLIARALAQEPELLILDEPTTYLDIPSKIELIKLLKTLTRQNNLSVLMSTHDLDLIQKEADKIWLMGIDGSFSEGSPEELTSSGLIAKNFFKSVPM